MHCVQEYTKMIFCVTMENCDPEVLPHFSICLCLCVGPPSDRTTYINNLTMLVWVGVNFTNERLLSYHSRSSLLCSSCQFLYSSSSIGFFGDEPDGLGV